MKKWKIVNPKSKTVENEVQQILLENRGLKTKKEQKEFLEPKDPLLLTAHDVSVESSSMDAAIRRIRKAIETNESIVVYADYDADGVTAGAVMWEALYTLGARVMPYIPHRTEEGYGFSQKGIEYVRETYDPTLIISVDHGITAADHIAAMEKKGIDVIVTDHHTKPKKIPDCITVHTTELSGAGIAWFVAKTLLKEKKEAEAKDLLALAAIGTIADMVPMVKGNRSIVKHGIEELKKTKRMGIKALIQEAGLEQSAITSYDVSHVLSPRINAMGRLEHALDSLRMLCTTKEERAKELAQKLGTTNKERQQLTVETAIHAKDEAGKLFDAKTKNKIIIVSNETYNQGIIGLVAGKLVETYWLPSIVIAKGEKISKASARSIPGFNIVEAIRSIEDLIIDVGGHPMAAGFTIETAHIDEFIKRIKIIAEKKLTEKILTKILLLDMEIPLDVVTIEMWNNIEQLEPYGFGNPIPLFCTNHVKVIDTRVVGNGNKHLKLRLMDDATKITYDAIAFGMGDMAGKLHNGDFINIAYAIDLNEWNGSKKLQLKVKDIVDE